MVLSIKDGKLSGKGSKKNTPKSVFSTGKKNADKKVGKVAVPKSEKWVLFDENAQVAHEKLYDKEHIAKKLADGINTKYSTFGAAATAVPASVFKSKHLKNCIGTCNIFNSYKKSSKKSGVEFELNDNDDKLFTVSKR
jgi:hypothetical protein